MQSREYMAWYNPFSWFDNDKDKAGNKINTTKTSNKSSDAGYDQSYGPIKQERTKKVIDSFSFNNDTKKQQQEEQERKEANERARKIEEEKKEKARASEIARQKAEAERQEKERQKQNEKIEKEIEKQNEEQRKQVEIDKRDREQEKEEQEKKELLVWPVVDRGVENRIDAIKKSSGARKSTDGSEDVVEELSSDNKADKEESSLSLKKKESKSLSKTEGKLWNITKNKKESNLWTEPLWKKQYTKDEYNGGIFEAKVSEGKVETIDLQLEYAKAAIEVYEDKIADGRELTEHEQEQYIIAMAKLNVEALRLKKSPPYPDLLLTDLPNKVINPWWSYSFRWHSTAAQEGAETWMTKGEMKWVTFGDLVGEISQQKGNPAFFGNRDKERVTMKMIEGWSILGDNESTADIEILGNLRERLSDEQLEVVQKLADENELQGYMDTGVDNTSNKLAEGTERLVRNILRAPIATGQYIAKDLLWRESEYADAVIEDVHDKIDVVADTAGTFMEFKRLIRTVDNTHNLRRESNIGGMSSVTQEQESIVLNGILWNTDVMIEQEAKEDVRRSERARGYTTLGVTAATGPATKLVGWLGETVGLSITRSLPRLNRVKVPQWKILQNVLSWGVDTGKWLLQTPLTISMWDQIVSGLGIKATDAMWKTVWRDNLRQNIHQGKIEYYTDKYGLSEDTARQTLDMISTLPDDAIYSDSPVVNAVLEQAWLGADNPNAEDTWFDIKEELAEDVEKVSHETINISDETFNKSESDSRAFMETERESDEQLEQNTKNRKNEIEGARDESRTTATERESRPDPTVATYDDIGDNNINNGKETNTVVDNSEAMTDEINEAITWVIKPWSRTWTDENGVIQTDYIISQTDAVKSVEEKKNELQKSIDDGSIYGVEKIEAEKAVNYFDYVINKLNGKVDENGNISLSDFTEIQMRNGYSSEYSEDTIRRRNEKDIIDKANSVLGLTNADIDPTSEWAIKASSTISSLQAEKEEVLSITTQYAAWMTKEQRLEQEELTRQYLISFNVAESYQRNLQYAYAMQDAKWWDDDQVRDMAYALTAESFGRGNVNFKNFESQAEANARWLANYANWWYNTSARDRLQNYNKANSEFGVVGAGVVSEFANGVQGLYDNVKEFFSGDTDLMQELSLAHTENRGFTWIIEQNAGDMTVLWIKEFGIPLLTSGVSRLRSRGKLSSQFIRNVDNILNKPIVKKWLIESYTMAFASEALEEMMDTAVFENGLVFEWTTIQDVVESGIAWWVMGVSNSYVHMWYRASADTVELGISNKEALNRNFFGITERGETKTMEDFVMDKTITIMQNTRNALAIKAKQNGWLNTVEKKIRSDVVKVVGEEWSNKTREEMENEAMKTNRSRQFYEKEMKSTKQIYDHILSQMDRNMRYVPKEKTIQSIYIDATDAIVVSRVLDNAIQNLEKEKARLGKWKQDSNTIESIQSINNDIQTLTATKKNLSQRVEKINNYVDGHKNKFGKIDPASISMRDYNKTVFGKEVITREKTLGVLRKFVQYDRAWQRLKIADIDSSIDSLAREKGMEREIAKEREKTEKRRELFSQWKIDTSDNKYRIFKSDSEDVQNYGREKLKVVIQNYENISNPVVKKSIETISGFLADKTDTVKRVVMIPDDVSMAIRNIAIELKNNKLKKMNMADISKELTWSLQRSLFDKTIEDCASNRC